MSRAEPGFTVHYPMDPWPGRPFADPGTCRHPGMMACPVGLRIVRDKRGGSSIRVECDVCLDCGTDRTGQVGLVEGLALAMAEMGHVFPFWRRISELVEHRRSDLAGQIVPLWMAAPLGMTSSDINAAMRAARIRRCAEYMGARIARYGRRP